MGVGGGLTVDLRRPLRARVRGPPVCGRGTRHTPRGRRAGPVAYACRACDHLLPTAGARLVVPRGVKREGDEALEKRVMRGTSARRCWG